MLAIACDFGFLLYQNARKISPLACKTEAMFRQLLFKIMSPTIAICTILVGNQDLYVKIACLLCVSKQ